MGSALAVELISRIKITIEACRASREGLLAFQQELSGPYDYIDEQGRIRIEPKFNSAQPFHGERANLSIAEDSNWRYGLINSQGAYIIQPAYNDIRDLGEQRLSLGNAIKESEPFIGSVYAIATVDGRRLTKFVYTAVEDYKHGLASVTDGKRIFFVDLNGQPAERYPRIDGAGTLEVLEPDLIRVFIQQPLSYVNKAGQTIWKQNVVVPLRPPFRVIEEQFNPNPDYFVYYPQIAGFSNPDIEKDVNTKLKTLSEFKPIPSDQKLDYNYTGDFEITFYQYQLLQLKLTGYNYPFGAAHGMPTMIYAIINLEVLISRFL